MLTESQTNSAGHVTSLAKVKIICHLPTVVRERLYSSRWRHALTPLPWEHRCPTTNNGCATALAGLNEICEAISVVVCVPRWVWLIAVFARRNLRHTIRDVRLLYRNQAAECMISEATSNKKLECRTEATWHCMSHTRCIEKAPLLLSCITIRTSSSAVADARRFVSLNISLSHSRSLKVIRNDTVE